jgi:hypothetical protein
MPFGPWTTVLAVVMFAIVLFEAYRAPRAARRMRDRPEVRAGHATESVEKELARHTQLMRSSLLSGLAFSAVVIFFVAEGDWDVAVWLILAVSSLATALTEFVSRRILSAQP